jgi:uncharacterized RDD family membrane protein YckC
MSTFKKLLFAAALSVIAWVSVALVVAQTVRIDDTFFHIGGRQVVRLWQDFVLRQNEVAREAFVLSGTATISGVIDHDLKVVLGSARLEKTAEIRGSVVIIGGDLTIADGAVIRRDLFLFGGRAEMPATFYPGGEHIIVGNAWVGDRMRAIVPWFTYGLLWGRLIVVSLGWVWGVVAMVLIVTLAINLLLHNAVGQCADTLSEKPASTFLTGLLVLLLTGPISLILAATLIGLAIVPFLLCAVIVAWIVGKVGVSRWIGRSILGTGSSETRLDAMRAVVLGFAAICLLYMVPIVGIVTWALVGVFGLGSASMTIMRNLRRERPPAAPKVKRGAVAAAAAAAAVPPTPVSEPAQYSGFDAPVSYAAASAAPEPDRFAAPVFEPTEAYVPPVPPPVPPAGLATLPRATFLDRLAAGAIDVALVMIVFNVFFDRYYYNDEAGRFTFLFGYFVMFWAWKGTTLGGQVCNLRVTTVSGRPLQFADTFVRGLAAILSFAPLGIGFLWILRDPYQQAWHDRIAGTYVVKVPRDYPL